MRVLIIARIVQTIDLSLLSPYFFCFLLQLTLISSTDCCHCCNNNNKKKKIQI